MLNEARKQNISEDADFYTDESDEAITEASILPTRTLPLKVTDRKGSAITCGGNDSRLPALQSGRVSNGYAEVEFVDYLPIVDEIKRALPNTPIFVLRDRFGTMSDIDRHGDFHSYFANYAAMKELHKRQYPRSPSLLWASFTCFGMAALFLVALIGQL